MVCLHKYWYLYQASKIQSMEKKQITSLKQWRNSFLPHIIIMAQLLQFSYGWLQGVKSCKWKLLQETENLRRDLVHSIFITDGITKKTWPMF